MKRKNILCCLCWLPMIALLLTACSAGYDAADATLQVKGNLDELYLGVYDENYMSLVGITEEEAEETYLAGLEAEAGYFITYYGLDDLTDEQMERVIELQGEIYGKVDYEVQDGVEQSDGTYAVKVVFRPLNIHVEVSEVWDSSMEEFWEDNWPENIDSMTEDEYDEWLSEALSAYNDFVIELVSSMLPSSGWGDEASVVIQIITDEDGLYVMDEYGFQAFDALIVTYP